MFEFIFLKIQNTAFKQFWLLTTIKTQRIFLKVLFVMDLFRSVNVKH